MASLEIICIWIIQPLFVMFLFWLQGRFSPSSRKTATASVLGAKIASVAPCPSEFRSAPATGSHDFKVDGTYSLIKRLGSGKFMTSDEFVVGGYSWNMCFYPDGYSAKRKGSVYIGLALLSDATDVMGKMEITLFNQSGKKTNMSIVYKSCTFGDQHRCFGSYINSSDLEAFGYLKDDCLHFSCRITVLTPHTDYANSIPLPESNINQHFGRLLESGEGADIKFQVDEEIFSGHKTVLAARSPVFKAQFFGSMEDADADCIKIEDMKPPVFKALLHYIYWDDLPNLEELTGIESKEASTLMSQHLLVAADRYNLDQLVLICASKLCKDITIKTVASILTLSGRHNCLPLKSACFKFLALAENLQGAIETDDWKHLKEILPCLYLELLEYVSGICQNIGALQAKGTVDRTEDGSLAGQGCGKSI